jgi:LCP family protein required for cell wall assembly
VKNILLLGNDVPGAQRGRTDSILLIPINGHTGQVAMLSIPRDLYVYIPGWTMNRINLAYPHGQRAGYHGGGGELVKDTIRYNLGIEVDHYVRVGFNGFKQIVDELGGVEIVVNCPIKDWRLKSPELNPEVEENWTPFVLEPGVQQMDGELALWYVRSRRNSNDIDRGRRQQKMLDALYRQLTKSEYVLLRLPSLVERLLPWVETDLQTGDIIELAAQLPMLRGDRIQHVLLTGEALRPWTDPLSGAAMQLLNAEAAEPLLRQLTKEGALHRVNRAPIRVEVHTHDPILYRQVAENLTWYGFEPHFQFSSDQPPLAPVLEYHGKNVKGSFAKRLAWIFRQYETDIMVQNSVVSYAPEYRVVLGQDHNPCLPYLRE